MTDDQLEGRDLDRACAEAMGWTVAAPDYDLGMGVSGDTVQWKCKPKHCGDTWALRAYSTDPSTQAEKLAWLHENVPVGYWPVLVGPSCGRMIGKWDVDVTNVEDEPLAQAEGTTIDEALARLICCISRKTK